MISDPETPLRQRMLLEDAYVGLVRRRRRQKVNLESHLQQRDSTSFSSVFRSSDISTSRRVEAFMQNDPRKPHPKS